MIASHADEALAMLETPTPREREVLGAFRYSPNLTVLHDDPAFMPRRAASRLAGTVSTLALLTVRISRDANRSGALHVSVASWRRRADLQLERGRDPRRPSAALRMQVDGVQADPPTLAPHLEGEPARPFRPSYSRREQRGCGAGQEGAST